jgi:hypothetical protein
MPKLRAFIDAAKDVFKASGKRQRLPQSTGSQRSGRHGEVKPAAAFGGGLNTRSASDDLVAGR